VAEPAFTQAFLRRSIAVEKIASTAELELLDRTLARIVDDPYPSSVSLLFMIRNIQLSLCGLAPFLSNSPSMKILMRSLSSVSFIAHKFSPLTAIP